MTVHMVAVNISPSSYAGVPFNGLVFNTSSNIMPLSRVNMGTGIGMCGLVGAAVARWA